MFGLSKYTVYAIIAGIAITILSTYVLMWKHNIRQQALLEFNNKQLEQVIKDQQKFMIDMNKISEDQKIIVNDLNKKNDQLSDQLRDLNVYLTSDQANKDSQDSSKVLKNTIKILGGKK
jgi:Tfp pilus assembly protein PilN